MWVKAVKKVYKASSLAVVGLLLDAHFNALVMYLNENREDEWDDYDRTNWRGLGLTDPVKNVEVHYTNPPIFK